jgi:glycosyltransferase involved in cell wall biosynthesis
VILDLHEAMPEFFAARFGARPRGVGVRLLRLQERLACRFATAVVTVNQALGDRLVGLCVAPRKLTIVPNAPSLVRFSSAAHPSRSFMEDGVLRLVYTGALSPTYELDVVFDAVARLVEQEPDLDVRLDLYGRDFAEVPLPELADRLGITERVTFHDRIPIDAVPAALAGRDLGLAPTRRTPFTDYSLSTKVFEYAAMGKPVVASRLPMVVATFGDDVATYEPGDAGDLARTIRDVVRDADARRARVERARARVEGLSWEVASRRYLALVDGLVSRAESRQAPTQES